MKSFLPLLLLLCLPFLTELSAQEAKGSNESMNEEKALAFNHESEAGLVITSGNSKTQSYNLAQLNKLTVSNHEFVLKGRYLQQKTTGVLSAKNWAIGLRYEFNFSKKFGLYAGELLESDIFAKYKQRYHSDLGAKYVFSSGDKFKWFAEAGYRFTKENRSSGESFNFHYMRLYSELEKKWNDKVSNQLWVEYLPNFTVGSDYQINAQLSTLALLDSIFSLKMAYLLRYDNLPAVGANYKTDNTFTTSLVAKF